jgi:hypothetical protein
MDQKLVRDWVAALRGGNYKQCTGVLRKEGEGFCCLGVLCDISKKGAWTGINLRCNKYTYKDKCDSCMPPNTLIDEVGLDIDFANTLVEMNDQGDDFEMIATTIERELLRQ